MVGLRLVGGMHLQRDIRSTLSFSRCTITAAATTTDANIFTDERRHMCWQPTKL